MNMVKILEAMMLVCFGSAWPFSITRSWRSRTSKGKSLGFLIIILVGYVAGIAKVMLADGIGGLLLIPYAINFLMVSIDTFLYFRNRRLDMARNVV